MTKKELIRCMESFTDDIEIRINNHFGAMVPATAIYTILVGGEGIILLKEETK